MSAVTGHIGVLKNSMVEFETVDYANQLTRARLVPETPTQTTRVLVPDGTITDVDSPAWTFELAGLQKFSTGGFAKMLNDAEPGDLLDVVWQPVKDVATQPQWSFTVVAKPVVAGGDQGAQGTFEIVLEVIGQPVNVPIS